MIKINKKIEMLIESEGVQALVDICEMAKVALSQRGRSGFSHILLSKGTPRGENIDSMIKTILDA